MAAALGFSGYNAGLQVHFFTPDSTLGGFEHIISARYSLVNVKWDPYNHIIKVPICE